MASSARFTCYAFNLEGSARQPGICRQLSERGCDPAGALALHQARGVGTGDENEIVPSRQRVAEGPERLSECPLHRVPIYGAAA